MAKKTKGEGKTKVEETDTEIPAGCIMTPVFRAGYVGLPDQKGNYSIAAMWPKDTKLKGMEKLALATLKANVDEDAEFSDGYKEPFNDGDKRAKKAKRDGKPLPFYEGMKYANFGTDRPVPITDENGDTIEDDEGGVNYKDKRLHSGAYFRAIVNCYYYDNQSEGVQFGLFALQFVEEGERIGGGAAMSNDKAQGLFKTSSMEGAPPPKPKGKDKGKSDKKADKGKGGKKDKGKKK